MSTSPGKTYLIRWHTVNLIEHCTRQSVIFQFRKIDILATRRYVMVTLCSADSWPIPLFSTSKVVPCKLLKISSLRSLRVVRCPNVAVGSSSRVHAQLDYLNLLSNNLDFLNSSKYLGPASKAFWLRNVSCYLRCHPIWPLLKLYHCIVVFINGLKTLFRSMQNHLL